MLHLRLIVPADLTAALIDLLRAAPEVTNLWQLRGAASKPPGDLVSCDVAKEEGSLPVESSSPATTKVCATEPIVIQPR